MAFIRKHRIAIIFSIVILPLFVILFSWGNKVWQVYGQYISHAIFNELTEDKLIDAGIEDCDKLMIVAHPDDDLLWGGAHLQEGGYFVLCLTNGTNPTRSAEFAAMIETVGCRGIILSYPDKVNDERSDWKHLINSLDKDLSLILSARDWKSIVTHNPDGEYGHIHHKMTSARVTSVCEMNGLTDHLLYFGRFYWKKNLPDDLPTLDEDVAARKREWLKVYQSQAHTIDGFSHMIDHEIWQSYDSLHEADEHP